MRWYARELGYGDEEDFWGLVGLLHDIDFEKYPEQHCKKAPELLKEIDADDRFIHAVVCHGGCGLCVDDVPEHEMEKVLFASDELTGLIWAAAKMRPSKSTQDMEVKSLKKKFKDKSFGWELPDLFEKTILAMRSCEESVRSECFALTGVRE
ncbi:hydrolase, partial [uncultured Megasphaera sp.]|uniref:hydrolase n=1 Tax=uncultured Megasphaera sp. TaxID=165188 RepID=UPI0026227BC9